MHYFSVDELIPGMQVTRNVEGPGNITLIQQGKVLSPFEIRRLKTLGVRGVYGRMEPVQAVAPDLISTEIRTTAVRQVTKTFHDARSGQPLQPGPVKSIVNKMVDEVLKHSPVIISLADLRTHDTYTFEHSVNVAAISVMLGRVLDLPTDHLQQLGLGALLHDIGKVGLPGDILRKPDRLSDDEFQLVREHPRLGHDVLRQHPEFSSAVIEIAYQHHERVDGLGYPRRLRGGSIHPLAKIVSVADVYDALTANRAYRAGIPAHKVLKLMKKERGTAFEPAVVDRLVEQVAPYPVGTIVRLSNGEIGTVVAVPEKALARPSVSVRVDGRGVPLPEPAVRSLHDDASLSIEEVIPPARPRAASPPDASG